MFILSCCSPCGESDGKNEYTLENKSNVDIDIYRFRRNSNVIDSIFLSKNTILQENGNFSAGFGGQAHEYLDWFDSVRVVYKDSIFVTHDIENTFQLDNRILGASAWEAGESKEIDCTILGFYKYIFTNNDFEEAKLKGKKVQ